MPDFSELASYLKAQIDLDSDQLYSDEPWSWSPQPAQPVVQFTPPKPAPNLHRPLHVFLRLRHRSRNLVRPTRRLPKSSSRNRQNPQCLLPMNRQELLKNFIIWFRRKSCTPKIHL